MKCYIVVSWAESQFLSDNLNYYKIPFALYVISWTECRIEINAGDLERVKQIIPHLIEWEEI
jgi:hypothetical protein